MKLTTKLRTELSRCAISLVALSLLSIPPLFAQGLTYVDANDGFIGTQNLFPAAGGPITDAVLQIPADAIPRGDDDLWAFRELGSGGTVFTSKDLGSAPDSLDDEDSPELRQQITTGLTPGASYDVYVAYWSGGSNWGIRAGFTSAPQSNTFYSTNAAIIDGQATTPGVHSALAGWSVLPPDNPTASDDGRGPFVEAGRNLLLGLIGTTTASPSGQIDVFIDDVSTPTFTGDRFTRSWLDGLAFVPAGTEVTLRATVDRATGEISFVNNTGGTFDILGYSITSAAGALDSSAWENIATGLNTGISDPGDWAVD